MTIELISTSQEKQVAGFKKPKLRMREDILSISSSTAVDR